MPDFTLEQRQALVEAILKLPNIADPARRLNIIGQLDSTIVAAIPGASDPRSHIDNIVNTCAGYPHGLSGLRTALDFFYNGAIAFQAVCRLIDQIAGNTPAIQRYLDALIATTTRNIKECQPVDLDAVDTPSAVQSQLDWNDRDFRPITRRATSSDSAQPVTTYSSFDEAFHWCDRRMLLLGQPGAGKSTTLQSFALQSAEARRRNPDLSVPLVVFLHRIKDVRFSQLGPGELPTLLQNAAAPKGAALLNGEPLLYILDGLDEMGGERPVDPVMPDGEKWDPRAELLQGLQLHLPDDPLVISCRISDYDQIGEKVELPGAITILPLANEKIKEFLLDKRNQPQLWNALEHDEALLDLARTPLLLALLSAAVGDSTEAINLNSAGDLIDFYTEERYRHEAAKHPVPFTLEETKRLLSTMAAAMWRSPLEPQRSLFPDLLIRLLVGQAADFPAFGSTLRLLILTPDKDHVEFPHLAFRDHFAVPRLVAALGADSDYDSFTLGYYDRTSVADALGRIGPAAAAAVPALATALSDGDPRLRASAARALAKLGAHNLAAQAVPTLITMLQDAHEHDRSIAAEALANLGPVAVPALIIALGDANMHVRSAAAFALGAIGPAASEAIPALITAVSDADQEVRVSAVYALGSISPTAA